MASEVWSMCRLRRTTVARLAGVKAQLLHAVESGKCDIPVNHYDHVSLDAVVNVLLERHDKHRERKARSAKAVRNVQKK